MPRKKHTAHAPHNEASPADEAAAPSAQPSQDEMALAALGALTKENAELKDQMLRAVAEAENVRRRAQKEIEDRSKYAVSGFAQDMLEVLENLHRAEGSIPKESREENPLLNTLLQGVELTKAELQRVFDKYGITRVYPLGQPFDHNVHQAVAQLESDEKEGTVVNVIQAGYLLKDRLLRPAMVAVAKKRLQ